MPSVSSRGFILQSHAYVSLLTWLQTTVGVTSIYRVRESAAVESAVGIFVTSSQPQRQT